jgi:hypothetical protein
MKTTILFRTFGLLMAVLIMGCATPQKHFKKGRYDQAITQSLERLRKGRASERTIHALESAFNIQNQHDISRLELLLKGQGEARWDEIAFLADRVHSRQELVRPYQPIRYPKSGREVGLRTYPTRDLLVQANEKAANWNFSEGMRTLDQAREGSKRAARDAYNHFRRTGELAPGYPDWRRYLDEAEQLGLTHVHIVVENQSNILLPSTFRALLEETFRQAANQPWLFFVLDDRPCDQCDFVAGVQIKSAIVSPDGLQEKRLVETKKVQDGFDYVLDERGNVMKDANGNDIKIPKYKELVAEIFETNQLKSARMEGLLEIREIATGRVIRRTPVAGETIFKSETVWFRGDEEALTEKTKKRLKGHPVAYPSADQILADAADLFRAEVGRAIRRDMTVFQP